MINVETKPFLSAVALAASITEKRNAIPALGALKVVANGVMALEASDLDIFTRAEVAYDGGGGDFTITNPRRMAKAVKASGAEAIVINPDGRDTILRAGALSCEMRSIPVGDHPGTDIIATEAFGCEISAEALTQIARVVPAMSKEKMRYYLNGIHVHKIGNWLYRFVATDGHRMHIADIPMPGATGQLPDGVIIPAKFIKTALSAFGSSQAPIRLNFGAKQLTNYGDKDIGKSGGGPLRVGMMGQLDDVKFSLVSKLIDGTFPDYTRVVPQENNKVARFDVANLRRSIRALTPMTTDKTRAVKLVFGQRELRIELDSPEIGKSAFTIAYQGSGCEGLEIGFNAQYLLGSLGVLRGDEAELRMDHPAAPTLIIDPADTAFSAILMPMRA